MPLEPDSPEFATLATRWLDGLASDAEATRLFEAILASPACARAFVDAARFEMLLEQTSRQIDQQSAVLVVAKAQTKRYRQRIVVRRALQIAAAVTLLGVIASQWWTDPADESAPAVVEVNKPDLPPVIHPLRPGRRMLATNVVMQGSTQSADEDKSLHDILDDFYLTAIHFDKVRLQDAIRLMKEQLKSLNFSRRAELDKLLVSLPADATEREVSFHSGAISFLKALQAIAGLADCDVEVGDQGIALATHRTPEGKTMESHTIESMIAAHLGGSLDIAALRAGLLVDARSLGLLPADAADLTSLTGSKAQFDALMLMLASRASILAMPDLRLVTFPKAGVGTEGSRVLTEEETKKQRDAAERQGIAFQPITIRPSSDELSPEQLNLNAPNTPDIILSARPAGEDNWIVTVVHATPSGGSADPQIVNEPIDAFLAKGTGFTLPVTERPVQKFDQSQNKQIASVGQESNTPSGFIGSGGSRSVPTAILGDTSLNPTQELRNATTGRINGTATPLVTGVATGGASNVDVGQTLSLTGTTNLQIASGGAIDGATNLVKNGSNTLTVASNNTYTGTTSLSGGMLGGITLNMNHGGALTIPSGGIAVANWAIQTANGTATYNLTSAQVATFNSKVTPGQAYTPEQMIIVLDESTK